VPFAREITTMKGFFTRSEMMKTESICAFRVFTRSPAMSSQQKTASKW